MDSQKSLKILFVGFWHVGLLISEELSAHGEHCVQTETSTEQARTILSRDSQSFDLLITGNRIQEEDDAGMDLVRWTKKNCPKMKTVLISVFSENEEGAFLAGADGFWHTSYDLSGLIQLIKKLFDGSL